MDLTEKVPKTQVPSSTAHIYILNPAKPNPWFLERFDGYAEYFAGVHLDTNLHFHFGHWILLPISKGSSPLLNNNENNNENNDMVK